MIVAAAPFAALAEPDAAVVDSTGTDVPKPLPPDRVVLYYFHRTIRCETCLKFEEYSNDVVREAFEAQLAEGTLEWRVVNIDAEDAGPLVERYELEGSALVSAVTMSGGEVGWRSLDAIWWLVDDEEAFKEYVRSEVLSDIERLSEDGTGAASDSLPVHGELVPESDGGGVDAPPQE